MNEGLSHGGGAPESTRFYVPYLDGLRCCAFFAVFIHHLPTARFLPALSAAQQLGWFGVELFFVISSYLLFRILLLEHQRRNEVGIGRFFVRRVLRIWPLYFTYIAAAAALTAIATERLTPAHLGARLIGLVTFTDNLFMWTDGLNPIVRSGHLWTLSFEEQVYVLIPVAFVLARTASRASVVGWSVAIAGVGLFLRLGMSLLPGNPHLILWGTPFFRLDSVILGALMGLQVLPMATSRLQTVLAALVACGCIAALLSMPPISEPGLHHVYLYPVVAVAVGALTWVVLSPCGWGRAALSVRPMRYLGKISYGLYVFHMAGIAAADRMLRSLSVFGAPSDDAWSWCAHAATGLLCTFGVAGLSYHLLEAPVLRLKERFAGVPSRPV